MGKRYERRPEMKRKKEWKEEQEGSRKDKRKYNKDGMEGLGEKRGRQGGNKE